MAQPTRQTELVRPAAPKMGRAELVRGPPERERGTAYRPFGPRSWAESSEHLIGPTLWGLEARRAELEAQKLRATTPKMGWPLVAGPRRWDNPSSWLVEAQLRWAEHNFEAQFIGPSNEARRAVMFWNIGPLHEAQLRWAD